MKRFGTMDVEGHKRSSESENFWHVKQNSVDLDERTRDDEGCKLVHVLVSGGAPWGFTLRGGLEHREPLLITKVEEGSRAAAVNLQVGDELVSINEIPLSGFKQEAICLVKGSHKTLSLVVKRRNEPISRPHSWHSTKFSENQSEASKGQSPPTAVWHDASSSASDLSSGWEQTNLHRASDQFSSLGSKDSLEHVPYSNPTSKLSSAKSNNSMERLGGGKRDSAYSSFSTCSSTPDYMVSKSNTASTENVSYKVGQWDPGSRHNNGRNIQNLAAEGLKQDDRLLYFQMPGVHSGHSGPQAGGSASCHHSNSNRMSFGPVWNVPEKKKSASSSPPPLPPARSDSFAATKAHERGLVVGHLEAPESHMTSKAFPENCPNISPENDSEHVYTSTDKFSHTLSSSNKTYSHSSSDVLHVNQPFPQSDKGTFHPQPWAPSTPKPQNTGGYYSQELPANSSTQHINQRKNISAPLSSSTAEQSDESAGINRYYCATTNLSSHPNPLSSSEIPGDRRNVMGLDPPGHDQSSANLQTGHLSQQQHSLEDTDSNTYSKHQVTTVPKASELQPSSVDWLGRRGHNIQTAESSPPKKPPEQRRSLPAQIRDSHQDTRSHSQVVNKICPQSTPMIHTLSTNVIGQKEKMGGANNEESLESKRVNRSNRFATTLRNEIQMRRAKLQKSRSALTLPDVEHEAEEDVWKFTESFTPTSAEGSFSYTYKDNLKEAQARVLKATSFRRKDLEPVPLEPSGSEPLPSCSALAQTQPDTHPQVTITELSGCSGLSGGQVTRVGGRKRFPPGKKVQSFSEPDRIHKVGVNEDLPLSENVSSSLDQQKLLKQSEKPGSPDHMPLQNHSNNQSKYASSSIMEDIAKGAEDREDTRRPPDSPWSFQDHQRLGTFAEYEARWNIQRKPSEKKSSGRYHSADNILDPGPEDRIRGHHERSKSSPLADIYAQIPVPDCENSQTESKPAELLSTDTRFSASGNCRETETFPAPGVNPGLNPAFRPGAAATVNHRPIFVCPSVTEPFPPRPDSYRQAESSSGSRRKSSFSEKPPTTRSQERDIFAHSSTNFEPNSNFYSIYSAKGDADWARGLEAAHHLTYKPSGLFRMEGQRSPSPQFSPQRLSDKPPVPLLVDESHRMEHKIETQNASVKKVPIRIVHSEGAVEKENSPFLQQSDHPLIEAEGHSVASLGALGQDSLFCAFTCQKEPDNISDCQQQQMSQRDVHMTTVGGTCSSNSQSLLPPPQDTTPLTEDGEQKRQELARDIMGKDKSLADVLDQSWRRTTMDLMEGIFPQGEQLLEGAHQRRKLQTKPTNARPVEDREKEEGVAATVTMVTSSTYYSISAPKAELLIKMKDMQGQKEEEDPEEELDIDLANKKQQLIDSLSKKLQVLREARESLQEDILDNNALGDEVEAQVQQVCKPNELEKFRMFVGDLDKVVSLLLSLSGRLARVENALNSLEEDAAPEDKCTLVEKRKLLIRQHEDAKELKENLDRRESAVYDILASCLQEDSLTDYEHFVKMKSALIIEQRKLEDKIKLGEEQLKCLTDSLPVEQRLAL